jgi:hypothetical protein
MELNIVEKKIPSDEKWSQVFVVVVKESIELLGPD